MRSKPTYLLLMTGLCLALGFGLTVKGESETMAEGFPDWTQAVALIGKDPDGNLILIGVDADGYLTIPIKGEDPDGDLVTIAVDADGQLFTIVKGSDGNILAVDSDGYMTAILKGLYGSTLKTLAVDDQGRIYGYQVDDLDQWGETLLVGNAEQAARLGSPVAWDRRGEVQAVFDFAKGFHGMRKILAGAGAAIELDPTYWQFGGYSAKLTGGSDSSRSASLDTMFGVPPSSRVGVSINFSAEATPEYLNLYIFAYISEHGYYGRLRYDFANGKLQYRDTGAAWQDIATQKLTTTEYVFHRMKLVIDTSTKTFVRAMLDSQQYDMTAALENSTAVGIGDYVYATIRLFSDSGDNDVAYIDTVTITTNEP